MTQSLLSRQVAEDNYAHISPTPIDIGLLLSLAHHPKSGGVVIFCGDVRIENSGKQVAFLDYEAHVPLASKMVDAILKEATAKWSLNVAIAQHRIGKVEVGETAVVVITCAPHRKEAYLANQFIIDKIKHEAPIWKCEYFVDGTKEWGRNCNC